MIILLEVQLNVLNETFNFGGRLRLDKGSRRLELLKLEGLGFSQAEVVNELRVKSACSKRHFSNCNRERVQERLRNFF